jgi:hypothetical protein
MTPKSVPVVSADTAISAVTLAQARELLGEVSKDMSDDDVLRLLDELDSLASLLIEIYSVQKST